MLLLPYVIYTFSMGGGNGERGFTQGYNALEYGGKSGTQLYRDVLQPLFDMITRQGDIGRVMSCALDLSKNVLP